MLGINLLLLLFIQSAYGFSDTTSTTSSRSNVIFVGGLSDIVSSTQLSEDFERRFGNVIDVSIIRGSGKQQPYAFVEFESSQNAQAAILDLSPSVFYKDIKPAAPIDTSKRRRSNTSRKTQQTELQYIKDVCSRTNLILQVQSTHIDRIKEFLTNYVSKNEGIKLTVEGQSCRSVTKNVSLVFVSTSDPTVALANALGRSEYLQFIARAVNKLYIVQPGTIQADLKTEEGCDLVVNDLMQNKNISGDDVESIRLQIFPPSCQKKVMSTVERMDGEGLACRLNPRHATDTISIVQVYKNNVRGKHTSTDSLVMSGVSKSVIDYSIQRETPKNGQEAISRAYYKIKEAISRYESDRDGFSIESLSDCIAIDCGSAPGGWTKFLAQDVNMQVVHSVDPGNLDIDLPNVNHMKMKIQDAIPLLKSQINNDDGKKIKVFVSDACLHSMSAQADFLLEAKEQGILSEDAFFVLTLKCTVGHGKATFDAQVDQVISSLKGRANIRDLSIYHLFTNRSGERTIVGKLT